MKVRHSLLMTGEAVSFRLVCQSQGILSSYSWRMLTLNDQEERLACQIEDETRNSSPDQVLCASGTDSAVRWLYVIVPLFTVSPLISSSLHVRGC